MKNFTKIYVGLIVCMCISYCSIAQNTYQSAVRFSLLNAYAPTDSNVVLPPSIGIGNALITSQPTWFLLGLCGSGQMNFTIQSSGTVPFGINDSMSVIIYGPFSDTINVGSKLINSNIADQGNAASQNYVNWNWGLNYQRGDIYLFLVMSSNYNTGVHVTNQSMPFMEVDSLFCPFCNGRPSEMYQPICSITYDSASQKNKIIWSKDIFTPAQDYVIYRKNANSTFDTVAYQSISQLSEFIDSTSTPLAKAHEYKLGIRDSCGQIMNKGSIGYYSNPTFTTTHLIAYPTGNNSAGLIWNSSTAGWPFLIYRTDPNGVTVLIDSVGLVGGGNQTYTDVNAPAGLNNYQIGVRVNPPCVPSLLPSYDLIKSNPAYVIVTGINELTDLSSAISIQPNPFNDFTKVDLHLLSKQNSKVVLRNVTGQIILQFDDVKTTELIINKNNLAQGLYFIEVTGNNFYARKKVVVN